MLTALSHRGAAAGQFGALTCMSDRSGLVLLTHHAMGTDASPYHHRCWLWIFALVTVWTACSPCTDVPYTIMWTFNAALPEGSKVTGILPFMCRDLSESLNDILHCR